MTRPHERDGQEFGIPVPPPKYPEHEKLKALEPQRAAVQEFIDWLSAEKLVLGFHHEHVDSCWEESSEEVKGYGKVLRCGMSTHFLNVCGHTPEYLIAKFLKIDVDKLEAEKREMLRLLREAEEPKKGGQGMRLAERDVICGTCKEVIDHASFNLDCTPCGPVPPCWCGGVKERHGDSLYFQFNARDAMDAHMEELEKAGKLGQHTGSTSVIKFGPWTKPSEDPPPL